MKLLRRDVRVHLVGIGGSGMSAIARVLQGRGYLVTGSDRQSSAVTSALRTEGIEVYLGHHADNLGKAPDAPISPSVLVVVSAAVPADNPEVVEARRRGYPVIKRDMLLQELTADQITIAVAGTHGKTTTTAMIAWILVESGLDPTFVVGSVLQNLGTNARAGLGPHFVVEADEYDRTFLGLSPEVTVVTILEHDHPDCYPTFDNMRDAFAEFSGRTLKTLIVCGEDPEARRLAELYNAQSLSTNEQRGKRSTVTYGVGSQWDWQAEDVMLGSSPIFQVRHHGRRLGSCALQLPGRHNVLNALAALAATTAVGTDFGTAAAALTRFRGTSRRFEVKGCAAGVTVVDDYAHHPTEIRVTLAAARTKYPGHPIWAVFQPHTFSRTRALLEDFASALGQADHVLVTRIFAAREQDSQGVSGADLVARLASAGPADPGPDSVPDAVYVDSLDAAVDMLLKRVQPGDVVITMGAGDGYLVGERVLERLNNGRA